MVGKTVRAGTAAERMRTLLAGTESLTLRTPDHRAELAGRHTVDPAGRLRLTLPADSRVARHLLAAGEVAAQVEVTGLAPVPMRDRVRSRATLSGWLTAADPGGADVSARLDLVTAELVDADGDAPVDPEDLAAARPDPLAAAEADLLRHLGDDGQQTVRTLAQLVPGPLRREARRIHPLRLDRCGLVLRLESATGHRDVRLPFTRSLRGPDQVPAEIARLLARCAP
ncbi:Protein of unknown function [Micromonospora inyonensis]|uniref:DUF2470 domain-containing protein n=2 Tax=Micromonospora inyonensis TaxID=47866 RepID=A0A1C6S9Z8_9ACTN|nr:Protein of unknown function [Micromonospora inyonensis]